MYPKNRLRRVALFGGSFNPPHKAHILLAKEAIKKLKLDLLIFIPTFKSVDKTELNYINGKERVFLLNLSKPSLSIVSSFELNLRKPVQSVETVRHFRKIFERAELYFLFGDDHLNTLNSWEGLEEIFFISNPVIFRRDKNIKLENLKNIIDQNLISRLKILDNNYFPHSSSTFRKSLNLNLLHKKVRKYFNDSGFLGI